MITDHQRIFADTQLYYFFNHKAIYLVITLLPQIFLFKKVKPNSLHFANKQVKIHNTSLLLILLKLKKKQIARKADNLDLLEC